MARSSPGSSGRSRRGAEITVYRAVDSDGIASEVTVACEMIRAVKEGGAQIVNLSLGCQTQDNVPPVALQAALEIISEWERETGREVLIVAAAGNFGDTDPHLARRVPPGGVGRWPGARHAAVAMVEPRLLGHVFDDRAGPALDIR